jgi:hypothetical protein
MHPIETFITITLRCWFSAGRSRRHNSSPGGLHRLAHPSAWKVHSRKVGCSCTETPPYEMACCSFPCSSITSVLGFGASQKSRYHAVLLAPDLEVKRSSSRSPTLTRNSWHDSVTTVAAKERGQLPGRVRHQGSACEARLLELRLCDAANTGSPLGRTFLRPLPARGSGPRLSDPRRTPPPARWGSCGIWHRDPRSSHQT